MTLRLERIKEVSRREEEQRQLKERNRQKQLAESAAAKEATEVKAAIEAVEAAKAGADLLPTAADVEKLAEQPTAEGEQTEPNSAAKETPPGDKPLADESEAPEKPSETADGWESIMESGPEDATAAAAVSEQPHEQEMTEIVTVVDVQTAAAEET